MKKWLIVFVFLQMMILSNEAEARRRPRLSPRVTTTYTYDTYDSIPTVDSLPSHGARKVQYGWIYEFRRYSSNYGVWEPVHPVGANPGDYRDGEPVHGSVRYKNGLRYTYDARSRMWISDWH